MANDNLNIPLTDSIITVISRIIDDSQLTKREPTHSAIEFQINRVGLKKGDPIAQGHVVGKAKRIRSTLSWALENDPDAGGKLVIALISIIKGCGGFRETSSNFVGNEVVQDAISIFKTEGYEFTPDGDLHPLLLDNLEGLELSSALHAYVRRAKIGSDDAALVTGTGKDLLEATASHILVERNRWSNFSSGLNFQTLLGQAFVALGLSTPQDPEITGEPIIKKTERSLFQLACAINQLRNKQGTGHGRPWLPTIKPSEAKIAIESMGVISEYLLNKHSEKPL